MAERNVPITLTAPDVQRVLRVVLDRDGGEALDILEKVVQPQVERVLCPRTVARSLNWRRGSR